MVTSLLFQETHTDYIYTIVYTHTSNWLAYAIICVQTCTQDLTVAYITNQSNKYHIWNEPVLSEDLTYTTRAVSEITVTWNQGTLGCSRCQVLLQAKQYSAIPSLKLHFQLHSQATPLSLAIQLHTASNGWRLEPRRQHFHCLPVTSDA